MSSTFVSRYATDFKHELRLGRGGFGVVFQARKELDDCQYAIKRVRLPNCDEAREKVMREVKALAKLEHPYIVRYFNAWFEDPPVGWQEENDETYLGDRTCTDSNLDSEESSKHPCQSNDQLASGSCSDIADDGRHATLTATDASSSFEVEFDSGLKGLSHQHDDDDDDADADDKDLTDSDDKKDLSNGEEQTVVDLSSSKSIKSSSCKSLSPSFKTSGSLLSVKNHKCNSKNCTKDTLQAPLYFFIQMQLCRRENLKDWLENNKERDQSYCLSIFDQIVNAVEYFHGKGMMHRDLKPSNIFFSMDGSVKVGDFGWVTSSVEEATDNLTKGKNSFIDANHTGQAGTLLYSSPEQIKGKAYSYKVDVFSLGLIFFELLHTFSTEMERIKVMTDVKRKAIPEEFQAKMALQAQLVEWLLSENPKNRPSALEIRKSEVYRLIMEKDNKNLADGLAWGFYFGYLKFVLPALKTQISKTEKYRNKIKVQKLFILLPKNCQVFDKISNKDSDPQGLVEDVGNLSPLKKNRGGIQDRVYKHTVHRITEKKPDGNEKHHFCVMEYATPLMTLHDMSDDPNAGLSKQEMDEEVVMFIRKLKKILDEDPDCKDRYQLITFSGQTGEDLGKIMIDALNNSETV